MTEGFEPSRLQARLWNVIQDLPPADRKMAESIAGSERPLTQQQKKAARALIEKAVRQAAMVEVESDGSA